MRYLILSLLVIAVLSIYSNLNFNFNAYAVPNIDPIQLYIYDAKCNPNNITRHTLTGNGVMICDSAVESMPAYRSFAHNISLADTKFNMSNASFIDTLANIPLRFQTPASYGQSTKIVYTFEFSGASMTIKKWQVNLTTDTLTLLSTNNYTLPIINEFCYLHHVVYFEQYGSHEGVIAVTWNTRNSASICAGNGSYSGRLILMRLDDDAVKFSNNIYKLDMSISSGTIYFREEIDRDTMKFFIINNSYNQIIFAPPNPSTVSFSTTFPNTFIDVPFSAGSNYTTDYNLKNYNGGTFFTSTDYKVLSKTTNNMKQPKEGACTTPFTTYTVNVNIIYFCGSHPRVVYDIDTDTPINYISTIYYNMNASSTTFNGVPKYVIYTPYYKVTSKAYFTFNEMKNYCQNNSNSYPCTWYKGTSYTPVSTCNDTLLIIRNLPPNTIFELKVSQLDNEVVQLTRYWFNSNNTNQALFKGSTAVNTLLTIKRVDTNQIIISFQNACNSYDLNYLDYQTLNQLAQGYAIKLAYIDDANKRGIQAKLHEYSYYDSINLSTITVEEYDSNGNLASTTNLSNTTLNKTSYTTLKNITSGTNYSYIVRFIDDKKNVIVMTLSAGINNSENPLNKIKSTLTNFAPYVPIAENSTNTFNLMILAVVMLLVASDALTKSYVGSLTGLVIGVVFGVLNQNYLLVLIAIVAVVVMNFIRNKI